jgi:hypothetical protein
MFALVPAGASEGGTRIEKSVPFRRFRFGRRPCQVSAMTRGRSSKRCLTLLVSDTSVVVCAGVPAWWDRGLRIEIAA